MSTLKVNNITDLGNDAVVTSGVLDTLAVPAGGILQVVSTTKTDSFSAAGVNLTDYDVTGLSATITPTSANNKILVMVTLHASTGNNVYADARIKRNGTDIAGHVDGQNAALAIVGLESNYGITESSINHLDSPASTSSLTYQVTVRQRASSSDTTIYVNRNGGNFLQASSTITLMEVAG